MFYPLLKNTKRPIWAFLDTTKVKVNQPVEMNNDLRESRLYDREPLFPMHERRLLSGGLTAYRLRLLQGFQLDGYVMWSS